MAKKKRIKRKRRPKLHRRAVKPKSKAPKIILVLLIVVASAIALISIFGEPISGILPSFKGLATTDSCGDNICSSGEQITCPSDCICVDETFDEGSGESA